MLEHLQFARSAYFFRRKKQLRKAAVDRLFRELRATAEKPSQNLFYAVRQPFDTVHYSAICFSHERTPTFLKHDANAVERVFGFLMLVENGHYVTLFRSGLDLPSTFKTEYLEKVGYERVEAAIASHDATFEKLRLRNMSISPLTLRSKSLEGMDLANAIARSSASRFIPQGYSIRRPDGTYSATPSTGRISVRSDRASYEELVDWSGKISNLLEAGAGEVSAFIQNFARPLELMSIPSDVSPTYVGLDIMGLTDALFGEDSRIRLVRTIDGQPSELGHDAVTSLLTILEAPLPISKRRKLFDVNAPGGESKIGELKINKTRITLSIGDFAALQDIDVEALNVPLGQDAESMSLARYIDRQNLFTVLFTDIALAYIDGSLFRDDALLGGGATFIAHLQASPELVDVTSEKGEFAEGQVDFEQNSVFYKIVDAIAQDDVLVCDDLGDEWADFIGVSTDTKPKTITFYHAKYGNLSMSASAFHEAVGQAIKNLGRMDLPSDAMPQKFDKWSQSYRGSQINTSIARVLRGGDRTTIETQIANVRVAPDVYRRAIIVTSSLSRNQVEAILQQASEGVPPPPHFVQLYWLLMSYFSACVEVGVRGYIVCRP